MNRKLEGSLTILLVVCAVVSTALVVHREFGTPARVSQNPVFFESWRSDLANGARFGSATAPIQLMEFADFECPFCKDFHGKLRSLRDRYPNAVSLTYVHFPIQGHRFALPAARAAECAGEQGRLEAMHDQLFEGQESLGLKPWGEYAVAAGVLDLPAFDACIKRTEPIPGVVEGQALGKKFDVQGTPTVIINGWKLANPPSAEELDRMVQRVLAGKSPVDRKS